jgi:hypothetical protein
VIANAVKIGKSPVPGLTAAKVRAAGYIETEIVEFIAVTIDNVFTKSA